MKNAEWRDKAAQGRIANVVSHLLLESCTRPIEPHRDTDPTGFHKASDCFLFYILPSSFFIHRATPVPPGLLQSAPGTTNGECRIRSPVVPGHA